MNIMKKLLRPNVDTLGWQMIDNSEDKLPINEQLILVKERLKNLLKEQNKLERIINGKD